mgnify:CR=1 FL=1
MPGKQKKTNPMLLELIRELKIKSHENDAPIWKDVAERLERPLRNWAEVNVGKIEKVLGKDEIALVPGKVLSSGEVTRKITVSAWSFSKRAREKIEKAGGRCISISDLIKENPEGRNVRIIG